MTKLADYSLATNYTFKLVLNDSTSSVYIDDNLVRDSIPVSGILFADSTKFYYETRTTGWKGCAMYYMKLKLGHT